MYSKVTDRTATCQFNHVKNSRIGRLAYQQILQARANLRFALAAWKEFEESREGDPYELQLDIQAAKRQLEMVLIKPRLAYDRDRAED